jgi:hypothetical protein
VKLTVTGTHFSERGIASKPWDPSVLRFTANKSGTVLYVHVFGNPADRDLVVGSLAADKKLFTGKVKKISVIGSADPVKWSMGADGLHVKMPAKLGFKDANVVKVETL